MKFNSYFVRFDHPEPNLTGNLLIEGETVSANFKKIHDNVFTLHLKNQVKLNFLENIKFKKGKKSLVVLLPVISKYNKRKLKKLTQILDSVETKGKTDIIIDLLNVENFLKLEKLDTFFLLDRENIVPFLIEMELNQKIKIIDFNTLYITSHQNYQDYLNQLRSIFTQYYKDKTKKISLTEIESKLKIPQSSIFFKYLLNSLNDQFSFKIIRDKIIFQKLALTEKERENLKGIQKALQINHLTIFSIENLLKLTTLSYSEINNCLWFLIQEGELVQLNERFLMLQDDLNKVINRLKKFKRNQGEYIDIKTLRELTLLSRKYIIPLFEYLDAQKITDRLGNTRKILLMV